MRGRLILLSLGALLGVALVLTAALLIPSPQQPQHKQTRHRLSLVGCKPYFLIPKHEFICGKNVVWVNPDGSKVLIGKSSQLHMPRPRPAQQPSTQA